MHDFKDGDFCPICEEGTLKKVTEDETMNYYDPPLTIYGLTSYVCGSCEEGFYDNASQDRINLIFQKNKKDIVNSHPILNSTKEDIAIFILVIAGLFFTTWVLLEKYS